MKKAISLIVLIISIIIMIIIAGAIILSIADNNIIDKAEGAKKKYNEDVIKETASMAYKEWLLENYNHLNEFTDADVTRAVIDKLHQKGMDTSRYSISVTKDGKITITDSDGRVSQIDNVARYGGDWKIEYINFTSEEDKNGNPYFTEKQWTITSYEGNNTDITLPTIYIDENGDSHNITALKDNCIQPISEEGVRWLKENVYLDDGPTQAAIDYIESKNIDMGAEDAEAQFFAYFAKDYASAIAKVTKITIPNEIKYIGFQSLEGMESISSLTEMVLSVDESTISFNMDELPLTKVTFMKGIITSNFIPDGIENIEIHNGVTEIVDGAFYSCKKITNITIPNSVTAIGVNVFGNCQNLTSVTLPNNLTRIENGMFAGCSKLTTITIPDGVTTIENYVFNASGITNLIIPKNVINIGQNAFADSNITNITLPNGLKTIDKNAFKNASKLKTIIIPNTVTTIGECAFNNSGLINVSIPSSVTNMGNEIFSNCSNLTTITLNGYNDTQYGKQIPTRTCINCTSLTSINISNAIDTIETEAFAGCTSLVTVLIPDSISLIDIGIFEGCINLATVNISKTGSKLNSFHVRTFNNCSKLANITVPNSITDMGVETFKNCTSLTSLTLPSNVLHIDSNTFFGCTNLTVTIPWAEEHLPSGYAAGWNNDINVIYGTEYYR